MSAYSGSIANTLATSQVVAAMASKRVLRGVGALLARQIARNVEGLLHVDYACCANPRGLARYAWSSRSFQYWCLWRRQMWRWHNRPRIRLPRGERHARLTSKASRRRLAAVVLSR